MRSRNIGFLLLLFGMACAGQSRLTAPIDGQVLEFESGKPIVGAIVVAHWEGTINMIVDSQSVCIHAETAMSDPSGRFHFDFWSEPTIALGVHPVLGVYKEGYKSVPPPLEYFMRVDREGHTDGTWIVYRRGHPDEILQSFPDEKSAREATHPTNQYMEHFTGTSDQRFEYLRGSVLVGNSCFQAGTSSRNLYPLYKAAIQEAKPLARSPEQQRRLHFMRLTAADVWRAQPTNSRDTGVMTIPEEIKGDLE